MEELKTIDHTQEAQYRKKLLALAGLYVKGYTIDWELLHQGEKNQHVSLPTYPFEKRRYWFTQEESIRDGRQGMINDTKQSVSMMRQLHPLLHENGSTLTEQKFVCRFDGSEFFFRDHKVKGNKVLPGVAYLEMARVAVELAGEDKVSAIKDGVWMRPIVVEDEEIKMVKVSLIPENNSVAYQVRSIVAEDDENVVYAQGKVVFGSENEAQRVDRTVDVGAIRQRCGIHFQRSCISVLHDRGLVMEKHFRR